MSLSLTKGLCTLDFVSISVTSKVRWRNSLCFITKPQQMTTTLIAPILYSLDQCKVLIKPPIEDVSSTWVVPLCSPMRSSCDDCDESSGIITTRNDLMI
jgi:hypothetical protein